MNARTLCRPERAGRNKLHNAALPDTAANSRYRAVQFNTWFSYYGDYLRYSVPEFLHRELVAEYGMDAIRPCRSDPAACGEMLFFDSIHPTARVLEIIGNRLADQILGVSHMQSAYSSPANTHTSEPSTWVLVVSASAVLVLRRRRRYSRKTRLARRVTVTIAAPASLRRRPASAGAPHPNSIESPRADGWVLIHSHFPKAPAPLFRWDLR
jgi:hypothetical protein